MVTLTVKGDASAPKSVEFSLEQDNRDVNVLANGDLIGYFERNPDGKIIFTASYPEDIASFAVTEDGLLVVE